MPTHSPAPWHISDNERVPYLIYAADGYAVCDAKVFHGKHDISSNMKLISAAPDLLAMLKEHHRVSMDYHFATYELSGMRKVTEHAIAKAEGKL